MAVPARPANQNSGCSGIGVATAVMAVILVLLLMLLGIIPSPLGNAESTPAASSTPPAGSTTLPLDSTPEPADTQTATPTLQPTSTSTATATITPTTTATPTEKPMPFVLRGTPQGYPNALLHAQYSCEEYLFIGGEIWDLRESPVLGITVRLGGTYGSEAVEMSVQSGDIPLYGESGFEFVLKNKMITEENLYIQLFDENGQALSSRSYLPVSDSCEANLIIVNFKQVR